jgi:hypothetical protein
MTKQKLHSTQETFTRGGMKPHGENEGFEKHKGRRYFDSTMNQINGQRELVFKKKI